MFDSIVVCELSFLNISVDELKVQSERGDFGTGVTPLAVAKEVQKEGEVVRDEQTSLSC